MKISKSLAITLIVIVAIVFIGVGVWVGIDLVMSGGSGNTISPYSAVYLSTGDVYFGKLDWSPAPHMEDAWYIQRSTDAHGNPVVGVYPFSQVAWGPSNTIYFNSQQIIFWTRLSATSSIAQLIANPSSATTAAQQAAAAQIPASATTTLPATSTVSQ